ncbi:MAG: PQQ-binding-like beta-propeller repeat protein [Planctomycetes bacterium]|nr:PQQ-binding-like beta-propeller repeat protein [Planctomycetota bacterium]
MAGAGTLVTKTLLIENQAERGDRSSGKPESGYLRAFDKATGEVIWETTTGSPSTAPPMSYVHNGKQYIAYTVGGRGGELELIAFSLQ